MGDGDGGCVEDGAVGLWVGGSEGGEESVGGWRVSSAWGSIAVGVKGKGSFTIAASLFRACFPPAGCVGALLLALFSLFFFTVIAGCSTTDLLRAVLGLLQGCEGLI